MTCFRIILFRIPLVIPTRTLWSVMLVLIGIFGFLGQVYQYSPLLLSWLNTYDLWRYF